MNCLLHAPRPCNQLWIGHSPLHAPVVTYVLPTHRWVMSLHSSFQSLTSRYSFTYALFVILSIPLLPTNQPSLPPIWPTRHILPAPHCTRHCIHSFPILSYTVSLLPSPHIPSSAKERRQWKECHPLMLRLEGFHHSALQLLTSLSTGPTLPCKIRSSSPVCLSVKGKRRPNILGRR